MVTSSRAAFLGFLGLIWPSFALAEPDATSPAARARFEAGIAAVSRGELAQALREFEAAYRIQPRFAVLFNIGQAEASLGHPVEAIASFERFLAEGGKQIPEARRAAVARLIEQNRKLTGTLVLHVEDPTATRVWLDGKPLSNEELSKPLALAVGEHTLLHAAVGGAPTELKVRVEPERATEIAIAAPPTEMATDASAAPLTGYISITCKTAGIAIEIAGKPVGKTPFARRIESGAGNVSVRFSRDGYQPTNVQVAVTRGATSTVPCALPLKPTRDSIARDRARRQHRIVGYSLAGAAVASLAVGAGVYSWNQGRYSDWRDQRTASNPMTERAVSIQRADDAAVGLVILGAGLSALATWTLLTAP